MTLNNVFKLIGLFTLSSQMMFANISHGSENTLLPKNCSSKHKCVFASAGFKTFQDQYDIIVPTFPNKIKLSQNRNIGFTRGNIKLTSKGVRILESGSYSVNFNALIQSRNTTPTSVLIPVYLVRNGHLNIFDTETIGNAVTLTTDGVSPDSGVITSVQASGIIKKISKGTRLSLIANAVSQIPQNVRVYRWDITISKLPCSND